MVDARLVEWLGPGPMLSVSPVLAEMLMEWVRHRGRPLLLVRTQDPYLLLGPRDARLPGLPAALDWSRQQGLPVFERISGGAAVLLDQDCLSFAVLEPCRDMAAIQENYRRLTAGMVDALASLGVEAGWGEAPGSYCPGPFDLVASGKKIAGIAQSLRRGVAYVGGMVLIRQDPGRAVSILEEFYRRAGEPRQYAASSITSLEALLGRPVSLQELAAAVREAYGRRYRLVEEPLLPEEERAAMSLLQTRRKA